MKIVDGKKFECKKCGKCCKWEGVVVVTGLDADRLAIFFDLNKEGFLEKYTQQTNDKTVLLDKPGSKECIFLRDNKCSVWDDKPKQCADFPNEYDKRCPGFHIDNRSGDMSDKYALAVKVVNEKLSGKNDFDKGVLGDVYRGLQQTIKSASIVSVAATEGIDMYLDENRMKVASLDDLFSFDRTGSNHLIHKCTRDLWSIDSDKDGNVQITRLFDNSGEPIKG
jgi:Fe-S-cluster containining protein